jgi:indole-3-glycerol phosphate synthase
VVTYLDRILDAHRRAAARDARPLGPLADDARACPPTRGFRRRLTDDPTRLSVIAEIKRRSPSKGDLAPDVEPAALARAYAAGGAACLSVLTDEEFFGGSPADLTEARAAVGLPVLRKDFTVSLRDVYDARLMGADAVLLIVAALDDDELGSFLGAAREVGLDVLVETHDEDEVDRAVRAGADLIGVNQRDLVTFEVDQERAARVVAHIPQGVVRVAESGISGPEEARILRDASYDAVLVGEHLVRSDDPSAAVAALRLTDR